MKFIKRFVFSLLILSILPFGLFVLNMKLESKSQSSKQSLNITDFALNEDVLTSLILKKVVKNSSQIYFLNQAYDLSHPAISCSPSLRPPRVGYLNSNQSYESLILSFYEEGEKSYEDDRRYKSLEANDEILFKGKRYRALGLGVFTCNLGGATDDYMAFAGQTKNIILPLSYNSPLKFARVILEQKKSKQVKVLTEDENQADFVKKSFGDFVLKSKRIFDLELYGLSKNLEAKEWTLEPARLESLKSYVLPKGALLKRLKLESGHEKKGIYELMSNAGDLEFNSLLGKKFTVFYSDVFSIKDAEIDMHIRSRSVVLKIQHENNNYSSYTKKSSQKSYFMLKDEEAFSYEFLVKEGNLKPLKNARLKDLSQSETEARDEGQALDLLESSLVEHLKPDLKAVFNQRLTSAPEVRLIGGVRVYNRKGKYVCTEDSSLGAYKKKNLKNRLNLLRGAQVQLIQRSDAEPFYSETKKHTFVKVSFQNEEYWVAESFLKNYEDCPQIQTEPAEVCSLVDLPYYSSIEDLYYEKPEGFLKMGNSVFKFFGHKYSSVFIDNDILRGSYIPVKLDKNADEVYWIKKQNVPPVCYENLDAVIRNYTVEVEFKDEHMPRKKLSIRNQCDVRVGDRFPLEERPKVNYITDRYARFNARRESGARAHGGVDLYTNPRGDKNVKGGYVHSIDEGEVVWVDVFTWGGKYRKSKNVLVQSKYGYTWNYAEITDVEVEVGDFVQRGQRLGRAIQIVRGSKTYPAMLHLEKFKTHISNHKPQRRSMRDKRYKRHKDISEDVTCHVHYMESKKFNGDAYTNKVEVQDEI